MQLKGLDEPVVAHAVCWRTAAPRIRVCGELAVEHEGARLDERLPSRQARALFALLVLERGHALGREAMADALWPGVAPRSRDSSLRALLSGVRRVFGPDSVDGRGSVRLVLPEGTTVDIEEAEASLAAAEASLERGDHEAAARAARRTVALTSQELLAGLSAPWIDERRAAQRELTLRALEIEAQSALAAGRPSDAERAARGLVEAAPYRESAHALVMQALAARREHRRGHAGVRPPANSVARGARDDARPGGRCAARPAAGRRRGGARGRGRSPSRPACTRRRRGPSWRARTRCSGCGGPGRRRAAGRRGWCCSRASRASGRRASPRNWRSRHTTRGAACCSAAVTRRHSCPTSRSWRPCGSCPTRPCARTPRCSRA